MSEPAVEMLKRTVRDFINDECTTMAAALAYYTFFTLPSLLLVVISVAGLVSGYGEVQSKIQSEVQRLAGGASGAHLGTMVQHSNVNFSSGALAVGLGILALIYGSTTTFVQLQTSLNRIWRVAPDPNQNSILHFAKDRLLSFLMVIGIAILFLVSLASSAVLSSVGGSLTGWLPSGLSQAALHGIEEAVSFIVFAFLFAAIFKVLPDADLDWREVRAGAVTTALLFTVGKFLIGWYLARSGVASAYGEAGSLVLIVLWVYYSALIILLGAEFTRVWSEAHVGPIEPNRGAVRTRGPAPAQ